MFSQKKQRDQRTIFFLLGLSFSLVLLQWAFTWKAPTGPDSPPPPEDGFTLNAVTEEIPRTQVLQASAPRLPRETQPNTRLDINLVEVNNLLTVDSKPAFTEPDANYQVNVPTGNEPDEPDPFGVEDLVFRKADVNPSFPGGQDAFNKWLLERLRYPRAAMENGVSGEILVSFVVDAEGRIRDAKIIDGIGWGIDEEVLRVLPQSPAWTPGKAAGKNVAVYHNKSFRFVLGGD